MGIKLGIFYAFHKKLFSEPIKIFLCRQLHMLTLICNKMLRSWLSTYKWFFFSLIINTNLFCFIIIDKSQTNQRYDSTQKIRVPLSLMIRLSHSISKSLLPAFYQQSGYYIDTLITQTLYLLFVFPHSISTATEMSK